MVASKLVTVVMLADGVEWADAAAFADDSRPVYYVGVNYSPRKNIRTVNDVACERAKIGK